MFETSPFKKCPECNRDDALGVLAIEGNTLTRRCKVCRYSRREGLPAVEKRVVYLDQLALSNIYRVKSGTMPAAANRAVFWTTVTQAVDRAYLSQAAVFPASSIHMSETTVFDRADDLRMAHEMLSGDTAFLDADEIEGSQMWRFARAFRDGEPPPALEYDVDSILSGHRNAWLPPLHVSANMSFAFFAGGLRSDRDAAGAALDDLAAHWQREKPSFREVLERELNSYGVVKVRRFQKAVSRLERAMAAHETDPWEYIEAANSSILREVAELAAFFEKGEVSPSRGAAEVAKFWHWSGNRMQPVHRNSAYLFAAIARRMANGKRQLPGRGALNDVAAIATYGPFVDALFVDNEFAGLLNEGPLDSELALKGPVFSVKSGQAFVDYLNELVEALPADTRETAAELYQVT